VSSASNGQDLRWSRWPSGHQRAGTPEKQGRGTRSASRACRGKPESSWVRVTQPSAGPGRGLLNLAAGSERRSAGGLRARRGRRAPTVLGALWKRQGTKRRHEGALQTTTTTPPAGIQSKSGHQAGGSRTRKDGRVPSSNRPTKCRQADAEPSTCTTRSFLVEAAEGRQSQPLEEPEKKIGHRLRREPGDQEPPKTGKNREKSAPNLST